MQGCLILLALGGIGVGVTALFGPWGLLIYVCVLILLAVASGVGDYF